jgi:DNA-binding response OmpR family regulator
MRKPRVIIYDDDVNILDLLKDYLSQRDYEVLTYNEPIDCPIYEKNADNCIDHNPCADSILTDFRMPRMNGVELMEKQSQRGCKLGIENKAIISGSIDCDTIRLIENFGCTYFKKPFSLKELSSWLIERVKNMDLSQPLAVL